MKLSELSQKSFLKIETEDQHEIEAPRNSKQEVTDDSYQVEKHLQVLQDLEQFREEKATK